MDSTEQVESGSVPTLVFYTTAGCHLCEFAAEVLKYLQRERTIDVQSCDISENEELIALYGIRIPVVKNPETAEEIGWPFDVEQLAKLLG